MWSDMEAKFKFFLKGPSTNIQELKVQASQIQASVAQLSQLQVSMPISHAQQISMMFPSIGDNHLI